MAQKIDYQLTDPEAVVLMSGTQDATAAAGALAAGRPGATGGRAGARLTRAKSAVVRVDVPHDPDEVRQRARSVIGESGVVIDDPNAVGDGSVWGLMASGGMNLATALVRVGVRRGANGGSVVEVRGTGQEGLIPQKIGAKAADRIAARLSGS